MADIFLDRISITTVRVQPRSIHGILWLQLKFPDEIWDALAAGTVGLDNQTAASLSQIAGVSGLHVIFP